MVAWEAVVSGTCEYARVKTTPCFASASRLGVRPRFEPRKPMRSARVVSSVIRIMLGDVMEAAEIEPAHNRITSRHHICRIRKRESTIGRLRDFDARHRGQNRIFKAKFMFLGPP